MLKLVTLLVVLYYVLLLEIVAYIIVDIAQWLSNRNVHFLDPAHSSLQFLQVSCLIL